MLADIKAGKIKRVVVKDMSRFGRNYLQVGMYTEMLFPEYGVHFIAVNDGVDSVRGDSEFTAIRNVFNEMYAKDTSKKIRATWQSKGRSGEHLTTIPPYGYKKVNVRQFIAAVRKYTDMQQLDASILREFVDKIYISEVYTPDENEPRIKVREIEIVYNFIGAFDFEEAREQSQAAQKEKKTGVA